MHKPTKDRYSEDRQFNRGKRQTEKWAIHTRGNLHVYDIRCTITLNIERNANYKILFYNHQNATNSKV